MKSFDIVQKLRNDLERMDASGRSPALFVFAVCAERDARLQSEIEAISKRRRASRRCPVELLLWEEILSTILDDERLRRRWYPELFPAAAVGAGVAKVESRFAAADVAGAAARDGSPRRMLWQMFHLARLCGGVSDAHLSEIQGALAISAIDPKGIDSWSNGNYARIGEHWNYPNGAIANIGEHWNYPNGNCAQIGENWNYPNGAIANIGEWWSFPNGDSASSESSLLAKACGYLGAAERDAVLSGLGQLRGSVRRLAIVDLVWTEFVRRTRVD